MNIDRLLARFSIQTKVVLLLLPLIAGIVALTAINLYTGSLLGGRLVGTNASIETLSGFKQAYAGMSNFLREQTEEKRAAVMQSLDSQLERMENVIALAENAEESDALNGAKALAEGLRGDVDRLWSLHQGEIGIREQFGVILGEVGDVRVRLNKRIEDVSGELAAAETEAKTLLRSAEKLENGAQFVVELSRVISAAQTPEAGFEAATGLKKEIQKLGRSLPAAIPATKPALKNLIADNMQGLLDVMKSGVVAEGSLIELQKFSNALRPTGIMLQGLASQVARQATIKFGALDEPILRGQAMIASARDVLTKMARLELRTVELVGQPDEDRGSELRIALNQVEQSLQLVALASGGNELIDAIGADAIARIKTLPDLAANLIEIVQADGLAFADAAGRIDRAWSGVLTFANSQQRGADIVKDRASDITLTAAAGAAIFGLLAAVLLVSALKRPILRLVKAMRDVASGDLDTDVSDNARADEIGEMARALDVFKSNAIDKIRVEDESERARGQAAHERELSDSQKAEADAQLKFAVQSLGSALRNLSQGDLVSTIDTPFTGELDALRIDFNESVERMRDALHHIRDNANSINHDVF